MWRNGNIFLFRKTIWTCCHIVKFCIYKTTPSNFKIYKTHLNFVWDYEESNSVADCTSRLRYKIWFRVKFSLSYPVSANSLKFLRAIIHLVDCWFWTGLCMYMCWRKFVALLSINTLRWENITVNRLKSSNTFITCRTDSIAVQILS